MKIPNAKYAIIKQIVAGIACLVAGYGIIWLMTFWASSWNIYWSDGEKNDFMLAWIFGSFGLPLGVFFLFKEQFLNSITTGRIWKESTISGLVVAGFILVFEVVVILLLDPNLKLILAEVVFGLMLYPLLGFTVGGILALKLTFEGFDPFEHAQLTSNEVDKEACKSGSWPYRHKIITFWRGTLIGLIAIVCFAAIPLQNKYGVGAIGTIVCIGLGLFLIFRAGQQWIVLLDPKITFIEGVVTKDVKTVSYRGNTWTFYKLHCDGREFQTDSQLWNTIIGRQVYRLWYSVYDEKRIVAREGIGFEDVQLSLIRPTDFTTSTHYPRKAP